MPLHSFLFLYPLILKHFEEAYSLALINSNLEALTGSLHQDFRLRVHVSAASPCSRIVNIPRG